MNLPPYTIFPFLSCDRVSLRQIETTDIKHLIEISFYDGIRANSLEEAMEMQKKIDQNYHEGASIHWGIIDKATSQIVGTCGFYRGFDNKSGELGCVLLPNHKGKGFMSAALQLAIDFGLHTIKLKRIWAITTKQNHRAVKLLNGLNFIQVRELPDDELEFELKVSQ